MKRKIKFKGLRTDGKGWVYGDLLSCRYEHPLILNEDDGDEYKVIPSSVGQFTGLHDKNGREIYEDDIVVDIKEPNYKFAVVLDWYWTDNDGRREENVYGWQLMPLDGDTCSRPLDPVEHEYKVIGNIHEK